MSERLPESSSKSPKTPTFNSPNEYILPNILSPPDTHISMLDSWKEPTPAQISTMSLDETRKTLLQAVKHIAMLTQMLRSERANVAHHTLQHKLLALEIHEASQRYSVEINIIRREVDRLLYELALPSNTFLTCQQNYQSIKQKLQKTLSLLEPKKNSTKTVSTPTSNNVAHIKKDKETTPNQQKQEQSSPDITQHSLMSPITFHSPQSKQHNNHDIIKEAESQWLSQMSLKKKSKKKHLNIKRKYKLRPRQSMLISPNISPRLKCS
ncbi:hypothetical protein T552_02569 [Pneumocystis carinii B80]|uniref:Uncharacterized protein n=1 Tax=Pneumocystis carinii (strain B80) TaxID=1408658 RepID=A0A0W4ZFC3_PNEC8|nr:hypothetical protein T552_02569 [Pneumocystis carinii B80]KTW27077.1 hypothetical protein T552_02569 [Pneumocystis carinii B80]